MSKPESSSDLTTVAGLLVYITDYFRMGYLLSTHFVVPLKRENVEGVSQPPNDDVIRKLSRSLRQALGVSLFGIDVIINNQTGQHAVIDINAFPGGCCIHCHSNTTMRGMLSLGHQHDCVVLFVSSGYEGVPEFFSDLLNHITAVLQNHNPDLTGEQPKGLPLTTVPSAGPWIVDGEGGLKGPRQRLACNSSMSPNFQQHCVSTIATKASSQ